MEESKNNRAVEKKLKDALKVDRARVQMGKISRFGLMEISRQRRRTGVLEGTTHVCEHCQGTGRVRSVESAALALLRALDEASVRQKGGLIEARAAARRRALSAQRKARGDRRARSQPPGRRARRSRGAAMAPSEFEVERASRTAAWRRRRGGNVRARPPPRREPRRRSKRKKKSPNDVEAVEEAEAEEETEARCAPRPSRTAAAANVATDAAGAAGVAAASAAVTAKTAKPRKPPTANSRAARGTSEASAAATAKTGGERGGRRRRRRRGRGRRPFEVDGGEWLDYVSADMKHLLPREAPPRAASGSRGSDRASCARSDGRSRSRARRGR